MVGEWADLSWPDRATAAVEEQLNGQKELDLQGSTARVV
jgi:hypothetical protein